MGELKENKGIKTVSISKFVNTREFEGTEKAFSSYVIQNRYFDKNEKDQEKAWKPTDNYNVEQLSNLRTLIDTMLQTEIQDRTKKK